MSVRRITTMEGETKWEVRYHLRGRGSKRVCLRFATKADAEAHLEQRTVDQRHQKLINGGVQVFEETTFESEAKRWMQIQSVIFSPAHGKRAGGVLARLLPKYGKLNPNHFHPGLLTTMQTELLSEGLMPASVNRYLEVVRAILNFSAKHKRIPFNPAIGYEKLPETRTDIDFWERNEAESFLTFANGKYPFGTKGRWKYVVYLLALNTALRAGEIWGLQSKDIEMNGEVLHIQRQFDRVVKDFRPTKGKASRQVPCNPVLYKELRAIIARRETNSHATIFQTEVGRPMLHDYFMKKVFKRDIAQWGGKLPRFHDLRHTGITLMIASGLDLRTVQEIAGHKDIKTTMRYAHLLADRIKQVARSFSIIPQESQEPEVNALRLVKA